VHAARFGSNAVYPAVETSKILIEDWVALREAVIVPSAVVTIYWRKQPRNSTPAEPEPV
jgi:hypothetical protein